jgi:hypothetical protein
VVHRGNPSATFIIEGLLGDHGKMASYFGMEITGHGDLTMI